MTNKTYRRGPGGVADAAADIEKLMSRQAPAEKKQSKKKAK
jgi:hypothetical protein|tara:strand:+ start:183 stop:305 length:123 start_codon:yes stop_codon:yes gene_type:complete